MELFGLQFGYKYNASIQNTYLQLQKPFKKTYSEKTPTILKTSVMQKQNTNSIFTLSTLILSIFGLFLSAGIAFGQEQKDLSFNECKNHEDSCLLIGEKFIKNLSEKKFDDLTDIFSINIFFRALTPTFPETSSQPFEVVNKLKYWFYVEDPDNYKVLDSKADVMVDCLHIYYKIFRTHEGVQYNVEQHLYCEIDTGKIQKLSLVCSGFRKVG